MIAEFDNTSDPQAHEKFRRWRVAHPDGYFLNIRGPRTMMLHRVGCPHLHYNGGEEYYDGVTTGNLAKNKKMCSLVKHELEDWAKHTGATWTECQDCFPRKSRT